MNKKQENQIRMQQSVDHVFGESQGIYQGLPALNDAVTELISNNHTIESLRVKQKTPTTGYTSQRDVKKNEIAELALEVGGSVSAYAHVTGDEILSKKVDFSYSELFYARDVVAKSRATIILNEAKTIVSELAAFGIETAKLDTLTQLISDFSTIVGKKSFSKEETQTATEEVSMLITKNSELLRNRIDKLMLQFRKTQPEFYTNYFSAREIYDFNGGKKGNTPVEAPPQV